MRILILLLAALPCFAQYGFTIFSGANAQFANGYSFCRVVTASAAMVSGSSDLTGYPLTVILTTAAGTNVSDLKTGPNGGSVNNASGYDIGFYDDTTCSGAGTKLNWEVETYAPTTGDLVAHVKTTAVHTGSGTLISLYYGGTYSTFQSTATAVWDSNYKGVWHLPNGSSLSALDSTSNANDGTLSVSPPAAAAGKIDGSASFNGTSNDIAFGQTITDADAFTVSAWVNVTTGVGNTGFMLARGLDGFGSGWGIYFVGDVGGAPTCHVILTSGGTAEFVATASTTLSSGVWYYVSCKLTVNTSLKIYVNGAAEDTTTVNKTGLRSSTNGFHVGSEFGFFYGSVIDEVRFSNSATARSDDWILTEYRNQSAPGTYLSVGGRITP